MGHHRVRRRQGVGYRRCVQGRVGRHTVRGPARARSPAVKAGVVARTNTCLNEAQVAQDVVDESGSGYRSMPGDDGFRAERSKHLLQHADAPATDPCARKGVPPLNRRSPQKTTLGSWSQTIESLVV